jgi:hypothetical protein
MVNEDNESSSDTGGFISFSREQLIMIPPADTGTDDVTITVTSDLHEFGMHTWDRGAEDQYGVLTQGCVCGARRSFVPLERYNALVDASVIAEHGRLEALKA